MSRFPPGLEPVEDLSPADWVREALKEWPAELFRVRDLIPPVFEEYARILHRPLRLADGRQPNGTWGVRAAELGRPFTAETRLTELEEADDRWSLNEGSLSVPEVATLSSFLAAHTPDPTACWFAMWDGWGFLTPGAWSELHEVGGPMAEWWIRLKAKLAARRQRMKRPRFATFDLLGQSGRSYLLFRGAIEDAGRFTFSPHFQSPTLWWPEDRAWFVHTEIDAMSTYLGGSRALIDRLVGEQILESFEVEKDSVAAL